LIILGIGIRILNSILFIKYKHFSRIFVNSIILLIGFILIIIGTFVS